MRSLAVSVCILAASASLLGQEPLSLREAVELALKMNPLVSAAAAAEHETEAAIRQPRSGFLPRVSFSESWQRSNNPVFVFGSLLTQHEFTAANFEPDPLNRPEALNNYQSRLSIEQLLFDARRTSRSVEAARFSRQVAGEEARRNHADIILAVLRRYFAVTLAAKNLEVVEQSLRSATADLTRAQAVFEAGRSTRADVLALRVHLAGVREQLIRAASDLAVAGAGSTMRSVWSWTGASS
jgi:outer membrane protein TolC